MARVIDRYVGHAGLQPNAVAASDFAQDLVRALPRAGGDSAALRLGVPLDLLRLDSRHGARLGEAERVRESRGRERQDSSNGCYSNYRACLVPNSGESHSLSFFVNRSAGRKPGALPTCLSAVPATS